MRIEHKTIPFEVKAVTDDGAHGEFEGLGAAFNNIDATGDIIAPGAFKAGLDRFVKEGFLGGVGHDWASPIGHPADAREVPEGLWIKGVYDGSPEAQSARARMTIHPTTGRATIRKLSIGYKAVEFKMLGPSEVKAYWQTKGYQPSASEAKTAETRKATRLLSAVDLFEVSPVLVPANDRATIAAVKAYGMGGYGMPTSGDPDDLEDAIRDSVVSIILNHLCMSLRMIVGNDMLPGDDRLALIGPAFDQCRDATLQYLKPLMGGEAAEDVMEDVADTLETMGKSLLARLGEPELALPYTVKALASVSDARLDDYLPMVASALGEFAARNRARLDIRLKEGRVLSSANVERIKAMRDSLRSHADDLHAMVESARPKDKSPFGGQPAGVMATVALGGKAASAEAEPECEPEPDVEVKVGVVPYAKGPILDDATWDGGAAEARVRKWASTDGSGSKDAMDWAKLARAYAFVDADGAGSSLGAYHLLHHDVEGGTLKVARRGVFAAAVIVQGGRGGGAKFVAALPDGAEAGIKAHLGKHYKDMDMTAPWDQQGKSASDGPAEVHVPDLSAYFKQFYATDPALIAGTSVAQ